MNINELQPPDEEALAKAKTAEELRKEGKLGQGSLAKHVYGMSKGFRLPPIEVPETLSRKSNSNAKPSVGPGMKDVFS